MKITVVVPVWKRPEVTRFCFENLVRLQKESKHDISVICVISEHDYIDTCKEFKFDFVMAPNDPLGGKINVGLRRAIKFDCDYVMMMNSDDVVEAELLDKYYQPFFDKLTPYFGINKVTYVNWYTKQAREVNYDWSVLGIAKMMSAVCVENVFQNMGECYPTMRNKGLDDGMMEIFIKSGYYPKIVEYGGMLAMDFKSDVNIHPWEKFESKGTEVCYSPKTEAANVTTK